MVANVSHNTMKGLQLFIADLRSLQQTEEQERRIQSEIVNIQKQFGSVNTLNGYQRKKYVAKLAYIYITTNTTKLGDIIFGLDQCCQLLASTIYSEKFIGYMTLELLYHHQSVASQIQDQVISQLKSDLASTDDNFVSLALNFIGVTGKCNEILTEELVHEVFQVLRSPTSAQILKKKSSLAFLALIKNDPSIFTHDSRRKQLWIQRIVSLLDDTANYRLMASVLPLVEYIAREIDYTSCVKLVPQLSQILYNCVVVGTTGSDTSTEENKFASVPNPWLVTKLVSLLNVLISSSTNAELNITSSNIDQNTLGKLRLCVTRVIEIGTKGATDVLTRTVQNTVLFSLINFASKLDPSAEAIASSVGALCSLLNSNDTNTRYLTLDSLVRLCSMSGRPAQNAVRANHMNQLFHLLRNERDSSIVRKLVDLLYTLTDTENVQLIVDELLQYMTNAKHTDHHIRSDLAVKVAILTEKFANDSNWYVIVSLKLLSLTNTSFNDDDIWQRLCQIVVNNESLHQLTCDHLLGYLRENHTSEAIVKTAAFLLGEYVNLVIDKCSVGDLFNLFTGKYFAVSNICRAMILATMMKLYKSDSQIGSAVIKFFQLELNSLDVELQTRSFEYLKIIQFEKMHGAQLTNILFSPMAPFSSKKNPLLGRLGNLPFGSTDTVSSFSSAGSSSTVPTPPPTRNSRQRSQSYYSQEPLSAHWQEGFHRMLKHRQGVLYSSFLIKILYRVSPSQSQPELSEVTLTYINKLDLPFGSFLTELISWRTNENPAYVVHIIEVPKVDIAPGERTTHKFEVLTRHAFPVDQSPILSVGFKCGRGIHSVCLKLGMGITSTILPMKPGGHPNVSLPQFIQRWRTISDAFGKEGECCANVEIQKNDVYTHVRNTVEKLGFEIVEQAMVENTLFAAGIIHTKSDGNFGCLMKLRCQSNDVNITCKTTSGGELSKFVVDCIEKCLT